MSKIGRKPIDISKVTVSIDGSTVSVHGPKAQFSYDLPECLSAHAADGALHITASQKDRKTFMVWGMHRAILANKIIGAHEGFKKLVKLVGLGYKGQVAGNKVVFALGYSHKIEYDIPEGVTIDIDKSGQNITVQSTDKFLLGNVCDAIRSFRPPEPYKGKGVIREGDVVIRKAGKTKA